MCLKGRCLTDRATQAPRVCLFLKNAYISKCFLVNVAVMYVSNSELEPLVLLVPGQVAGPDCTPSLSSPPV